MSEYPDIEQVLIDLLTDAAIADNADRTLPANLRYRMPFCLVERRGGPDNGWTDSPVVNIDWLSSQPGVAKAKAEATRQFLHGDPLTLWPIDRVETVAGPQEIPHGDSSVLRWTTAYQFGCRRAAAS